MSSITRTSEAKCAAVRLGLSAGAELRRKLAAIRLRFTETGAQARTLAGWLERVVLPKARQADRAMAPVRVDEGAFQVEPRDPQADEQLDALEGCELLAESLRKMGIRRMMLDCRLESNQIGDVLALLFAHRRALARGEAPARLGDEEGLSLACTRTSLRRGMLRVEYSYCATRFSRLVHWIERMRFRKTDHRALFSAAPKYALLAAAITVIPFVLYYFHGSKWVLLIITAAVAVAVFVLVYLFFMTAGSLEYDNEEKAFRLSVAVRELREYASHVQDDLLRARTVQQNILPATAHMPLPDKLEWASRFEPQTEIGGDYFDAAELDDGRAAVFFTDVSGHGMAAAFQTAILKTAFQTWIDDGHSPLEDFVRRSNHLLCRLTPSDSFAAAFTGVYDPESRTLHYINSGHNPEPWRIPADAAEPIERLNQSRSLLLGVMDDLPLEVAALPLRPGDKLLMVTDGIIEARSRSGEMFTTPRLESALEALRGASTPVLVQAVMDEVNAFTEGAPQGDDRAVLAVRLL